MELLATRTFAHRGLHGLVAGTPENSLAAFRAAVDRGYGIELDVRVTADGEAIVFHDAALDRLTGDQRLVNETPAMDLTATTLRNSSESIPTLAETLAMVHGAVPVLVEMKLEEEDLAGVATPMQQLVRRSVELVRPYKDTVALMSFRAEAMRYVRRIAPEIICGWVTVGEGPAPHDAMEPGDGNFVAWRVEDLPTPYAAQFRRAGNPVFAWTVRDPQVAARAQAYADAIIFEDFCPPVTP